MLQNLLVQTPSYFSQKVLTKTITYFALTKFSLKFLPESKRLICSTKSELFCGLKYADIDGLVNCKGFLSSDSAKYDLF